MVIEGTEDAGKEIFEECTNELFTKDSPNGVVQDIAKRIGCKMQSICPLKVDVADGCEMILGVQCKVLLRGTPQTSIQWMQGKWGRKIGSEAMLNSMTLCVYPHTLFAMEESEHVLPNTLVKLWKIYSQSGILTLGNLISLKGTTDKSKIQAIKDWSIPKTVKQLRGFLGLTRYYRMFIRHYAIITKPLTQLLKKQSFQWNDAAQVAFETLKSAMMSAPVLSFPDFKKDFINKVKKEKTENALRHRELEYGRTTRGSPYCLLKQGTIS
ncbi:hypothetical protein Tco_0705777 [Tanacetum coccineum]|uniref:Reverse transcriptase/retrotransposon-derived protein RNase H-like domain-containing protein n=1 Tax=Tanacetum coccineum TaxID=301880 RepID=A0ABQ4Y6F0_9ASTR